MAEKGRGKMMGGRKGKKGWNEFEKKLRNIFHERISEIVTHRQPLRNDGKYDLLVKICIECKIIYR